MTNPIRTPAEALDRIITRLDQIADLRRDNNLPGESAFRQEANYGRALLARIAAPDHEVLAWRPGSEAPAIPSGTYAYFIVVVRRAQARAERQVFTFPACYLNAYPLEWDGGDGCPITGWFDCRFSSDYDYYYEQLLNVGDEVLEWAAIPDRGAALREAGALRHE